LAIVRQRAIGSFKFEDAGIAVHSLGTKVLQAALIPSELDYAQPSCARDMAPIDNPLGLN